jgi:hypothetical protein
MRMLTKTVAALGFVSALAVGTPTASMAQGIYFGGPGVSVGIGAPYYGYRYHRYYGGPYRSWAYERPYYRHYRHRYWNRW